MTYPAPPGPRIMYDRDGSVGFYLSSQGVREAQPDWLTFLNSDTMAEAGIAEPLWVMDPIYTGHPTAGEYSVPVDRWYAIRFPEPMRIRGVASSLFFGDVNNYRYLSYVVESSSDSTNGQDGTWQTLISYGGAADDFDVVTYSSPPDDQALLVRRYHEPGATGSAPYHARAREAFTTRRRSFGLDGIGWHETAGASTRQVSWVRARVLGGGTYLASSSLNNTGGYPARGTMKLHLYGEPDTNASDARLQFVSLGGAFKGAFDFGDMSEGDSSIQQFRVQNLHTLEARGVVLNVNAANPDVTDNPAFEFCRLSVNGGAYSASVGPFDIPALSSSDIVSLRVQPGAGRFGPWSPRLTATLEEWA